MAKARSLDKRRKSIRNTRKITRTMELIATSRFKRAMDRAVAAKAYTERVTRLVADLAKTGLEVKHPLLEPRPEPKAALLLVLTANRGMCGGYNSSVLRVAVARHAELADKHDLRLEVSGKRGVAALRYRQLEIAESFTHFEDRPRFDEVSLLANRYLDAYTLGEIDRLDVVFTKFHSSSRQFAVVETLLPLGSLEGFDVGAADPSQTPDKSGVGKSGAGQPAEKPRERQYDFLPSAASILQEVVPASFRTRLFKCFLDSAVSEQIARMVAMKSATENAGEMIKELSRAYNRARQSQITNELMDIIGGVEALKK